MVAVELEEEEETGEEGPPTQEDSSTMEVAG